MPAKYLKRFRIQDVEPGMILGRTILNDQGRVILDQGRVSFQEGTAITREGLDRLLNWNIRMVEILLVSQTPNGNSQNNGMLTNSDLSNEILERMVGACSLSVILDRLTQGLGKLHPESNVFTTLIEGEPARWWVMSSAGTFRQPDAPLEQKFGGADYLAGKQVIIGDLATQKVPPSLARADMLSMCGIPIIVEGVTVGSIELFSQRPAAFSPEDVAQLERYAKQAAVAVRCNKVKETLRKTTEEKDLLYEIMGFVAAAMPPATLLSKVADSLANYFSAHAVASFSIQRLPHINRPTEILARNFSRNDLENLKEIFASRWPANGYSDSTGDGDTEGGSLERQNPFTVSFSGGKSIYILPLFSRDLLQGIVVLLWEYDRKIDFHSHMDEMVRIVASQTGLGLERHHLYTGVEKIGFTDDLTGLSNRRMFNYLIEREINRSRRYCRPVSLVMMDIDYFKKINDTWGHTVGDMVLRELGALMRANFRKLDVPVRYGGEEFAAILPETPLEEAVNFAERFRIMVEQTVFSNGRERIPVTLSLGIASIGNTPVSEKMDSDEFIQMADRALYQAKQSGRNRIAAGRSV